MTRSKSSRLKAATTRGDDADRGAREPSSRSRVLRIIGGRHRGRKLRFPAGSDIRPTPDRVRETLFNWLQPRIVGARVLDLFSGSGALALESVSRGAAAAICVERDRRAAAAIESLAREWDASGIEVFAADALDWLARPVGAFDIVFLDPPYDAGVLGAAAAALVAHARLAPGARVFVESRARDALPALPEGWKRLRSGRAGEVGYHLYAT